MAPVLPTINLGPQTPVNMGDVFNPVGISQTDYASRPVNFYGEGLDTSINVDTVDEQEDGADEVLSPSIYGDDDRGDSIAGQGQIISGDFAGSSVLQGAFASTKMYGVSDINLDSSAFKGTDLTKSPFSNYFDVAVGELTNVAKAQKAAGLGTPIADSIIKGRPSAVGVPGAMAPMLAAAGPIGALMPLGAAAARAMQARDAASIMAANGKAGAMFELGGMLLTRPPGSFQYTGNMQGYTTEQIKAIEAVKLGYIPGTFTETKMGDTWVQNGTKFMFGQTTDSVVAGGGTYDPATGSFIGLDNSRAASGSMKSAAELTKAVNNMTGGSLKPGAVAVARSKVQRTGLFGMGGVKPGTKTFMEILRDMALKSDYKNADTQKQAESQKAKIESGQYTSTDSKEDFDSTFGDDGGSGGFTESETGQISDAFGGGDAYGGTITHGRPQNRYVEGGSVDDASDDEMGDVATMESSYSADPDAFSDEDAGMYDSSDGGNNDDTIEAIRQNILSAVSAKQLSKSDKKQFSEQMAVIGSRNKFNEAVKKEMDRFKSTEYKPSTNTTRKDVIGQTAKSSLRDIITNAPVIAAEGMALGPMVLARELGITGRIDKALGVSKAFGIEPDQPMIGTDVLTQMGFGHFVNPFKADGGRVGYAPGGDVGFAQRPEFVGGKQSQPDGVSVADDQPRDVQEGSFVINAAAADFAGRDDIEKMIRTAYKKVGDIGQTGQSQEVAINVSKGEVIIPAHIAKVIGYDRLNKINNRGKKEIARRQEKVEAAGGGFIQRKKFADGGGVDNLYTGPLPQPIGSDIVDERIRQFGPAGYGLLDEDQIRLEEQTRINPAVPSMVNKQAYRKGVEFGDMEAGFSLLGRTNYNDTLLAGLRDTRTLSDFVKTLGIDEDISGYFGSKPAGAFRPTSNRVLVKNPEYFAQPSGKGMSLSYDAVLGHELMHKGADALANDPNFKPSETLVKAQRAWKANEESRKDEIGGNTPEHRYIQSVINEAYMLRDVDSVLGKLQRQQKTGEPVRDLELYYDENNNPKFETIFRQINKTDLAQAKTRGILREMRRSYNSYLTDENKKQFLEENKEYLYDKYGTISMRDSDVPFTTAAGIFRSLNRIMAQDYATKLFESAIANKPIEVQRKPDRKPEPQLAPEPKYERGFLEKALGISPAY